MGRERKEAALIQNLLFSCAFALDGIKPLCTSSSASNQGWHALTF